MRRALGVAVMTIAAALPLAAQTPPGHRLPEGTERAVRDRDMDVQHVEATLRFDMAREEIAAAVAVTFVPLRPGLQDLAFDAASLEVSAVELDGTSSTFATRDNAVRVHLG